MHNSIYIMTSTFWGPIEWLTNSKKCKDQYISISWETKQNAVLILSVNNTYYYTYHDINILKSNRATYQP